jgi:hypothetical protein
MGEDAVVYKKERPRQRGSNRDEIVVLVVLLFWRGDIAGRCARFAPSEENETNVALNDEAVVIANLGRKDAKSYVWGGHAKCGGLEGVCNHSRSGVGDGVQAALDAARQEQP